MSPAPCRKSSRANAPSETKTDVETILLLTGIGFLLLLTEIFLPGGVLGAIGGILLVAAVIVGYVQLGPIAGTVLLCIILVCVLVGFCIGMAMFPHTPLGRRMTLGQTLGKGSVTVPPPSLLGCEGIAITLLRPSGKALIEGRKVDVVAEGDFVEQEAAIVVIAEEGPRVVVRKKA